MNRFNYNIQKINMRVGIPEYRRQYRATFVTKLIDGNPVDRWVTIEAYPERLRQHLFRRIIETIGKCRLIDGCNY